MDSNTIALPPSVWGPIFWNTIHIVTLGYSKHPTSEEQDHMRMFFESLKTVIPCPVCREHYKEHLKTMPIEPALKGRAELVEYAWTLHNKVNEMLEKPHFTQEQFIQHMKSLGQTSRHSPMITGGAILGGIAVGALGMYMLHRMTRK
jgi:hypothetical protein